MSKKAVGNEAQNTHWFPAKAYGYGWGLPRVWQGWAVLIGLLTAGLAPLMYLSVFYKGDEYCQKVLDQGVEASCNPEVATGIYVVAALCWLVSCIMLLYIICEKKGEKARWRWGKSSKKHATKS